MFRATKRPVYLLGAPGGPRYQQQCGQLVPKSMQAHLDGSIRLVSLELILNLTD